MSNKLVLAPLKGYTDPLWRSCYFDHFSGIDKVVTPFLLLSEHNRAKPSYFPQFFPEIGSDIEVVPQFLVKNPDTILHATSSMNSLGIKEYNLNMGCPAPAIYKKGRGSGLMENLDIVRNLLDGVLGKIHADFTVKIRTGIVDSSLIKPLLNLLNSYELKEVIVHPRFARQLYSGSPDLEAFSYVYENCTNPVSYNGDIYTLEDFNKLYDRYPNVSSWMIGRGVLRDPFLPSIIKSGKKLHEDDRKVKLLEYIYDFNERVNSIYPKERTALNRSKSILNYIAAYYNDSEEFINRVKRCSSLDQMLDIISLK